MDAGRRERGVVAVADEHVPEYEQFGERRGVDDAEGASEELGESRRGGQRE